MLILESSGGRNIFGHSPTRCVDDELGYFKGGEVTRASYEAYKAKREMCGYQGVGVAQLTWGPLQDQADGLGGCWDPAVNCHVGFKVLDAHIRAHGETEAFGRYRAGVRWREYPAAVSYVRRAMELLATWRAIVSGHPVSSAPSSEG